MDILTMIAEKINKQATVDKLGRSAGIESEKTQKLIQMGLPALLRAMGQNASTAEGAMSLSGALEQHQDDPVDDVQGFLDQVNTDDGEKILSHIFSGNKDQVNHRLADKTGLESRQVAELMKQLAPLVLGMLGQQKKKQNLNPSGIAGLFSGVQPQGSNSGVMGLVTNLLDADKDSSIADDVGGILQGLFKK
jgi:hypothetical protein